MQQKEMLIASKLVCNNSESDTKLCAGVENQPVLIDFRTQARNTQGRIQKEGAEETDDAVLHHSGSICDQTLRRSVKNFLKIQGKIRGARPPSKSAPVTLV